MDLKCIFMQIFRHNLTALIFKFWALFTFTYADMYTYNVN